MAKSKKTVQQITADLNGAVRRHDLCEGITVGRIHRVEQTGCVANWDAEFLPPPQGAISPDCKRVLISAKQAFQRRFDLVE